MKHINFFTLSLFLAIQCANAAENTHLLTTFSQEERRILFQTLERITSNSPCPSLDNLQPCALLLAGMGALEQRITLMSNTLADLTHALHQYQILPTAPQHNYSSLNAAEMLVSLSPSPTSDHYLSTPNSPFFEANVTDPYTDLNSDSETEENTISLPLGIDNWTIFYQRNISRKSIANWITPLDSYINHWKYETSTEQQANLDRARIYLTEAYIPTDSAKAHEIFKIVRSNSEAKQRAPSTKAHYQRIQGLLASLESGSARRKTLRAVPARQTRRSTRQRQQ